MKIKKIFTRYRKKDSELNRPPKIFIFLFGLIFIFATINLVNDLRSSQGLKPFGFIENIWAAARKITGEYAPNTQNIANNLVTGAPDLYDSPDRCQIIDPNLDSIKTVAEVGFREEAQIKPGKSIAGINQAKVLDGQYNSSEFGNLFNKANSLGMSYVLGMATKGDAATVDSTAQYITEANKAGVIPIVRLCYVGNCEFKTEDSIFNFYKDVHEKSTGEFIAMIGPNEPGTGTPKEMYGFVGDIGQDAAYSKIVSQTNSLAERLATYRVENGGSMYLSPGAFNLTNSQSNDVKQMLYSSNNLDLSKFDYVMGNSYEGTEGGGFDKSDQEIAYDYYEKGADNENSLKAKVDAIGIKVIITEFGIIREEDSGNSYDSEMISRAKESFANLCKDENIAGVMFYRTVKGMTETEFTKFKSGVYNHALEDQQIKDIVGACTRGKQDDKPKDWAWANCNFDSCLYNDSYDQKSTAAACGATEETKPSGYYLMLTQDGPDFYTKKVDTVEVSMPIKQFGSNSPSGPKDYTPLSFQLSQAEITAKESDSGDEFRKQDPLNQFAGRLKGSNGEDYPMPWLGSALNNSSKLIKAYSTYLSRPLEEDWITSDGSKYSNQFAELNLESDAKRAMSSIHGTILDERSICKRIDGEMVCGEKDQVAYNDAFKSDYLAPLKNYSYLFPKQCESSNLVIRNEPSNYIIGPEVKITDEKKEKRMNVDTLCKEFGQRKTDKVNPNLYFPEDTYINCSVEVGRPIKDTKTGLPIPGLFCQESDKAKIKCMDGRAFFGTNSQGFANYSDGKCVLDHNLYAGCFQYVPSPNSETFYKQDEYADVPTYDIPGAYDSLYEMYKRLNDSLSASGRKIIFRENIGWDVKVSTKVRDLGWEFKDDKSDFDKDKTPYLYALDGMPQCNLTEKIFKNESFLAKGEPIKTKDVFYDWLGTLDIMQEIQSTYVSTYTLRSSEPVSASEFWSGTGISVSALNNKLREKIYLPDGGKDGDFDLAIKQTSFPLYTCDEIERYNIINGLMGTPNEVKYTCIAHQTDEYYLQYDELVRFLHCEKGYEFDFPVRCEAGEIICYAKPIGTSGTNNNTSSNGSSDSNSNSGTPSLSDQVRDQDVQNNQSNNTNSTSTSDALREKLVNTNQKGSQGYVVDTSKLPSATNQTTQAANITLRRPVSGFKVTSCNGDNVNGKGHLGLDLSIPLVTPVYASADGTVLIAGWNTQGYGNLVKINHGGGVTILYAHNTSVTVKEGQQVTAGQLIAYSGSTGNSSGPHLHYEMRLNDKNIDPAPYLNLTTECPNRNTETPSLPGVTISESNGTTTVTQDGVKYEIVCDDPGADIPDCTQVGNPSGPSTPNDENPLDTQKFLIYPVENPRVSSVYFAVRTATYFHEGVDFGLGETGIGLPVMAAADGKVIFAGWDTMNTSGAYGNVVMIQHKNGMVTLYAHNSKVLVKVGDEVKQRYIIALSGSTGNSTGPHVHFELRRNSTCAWDGNILVRSERTCTVDPMLYIDGAKPSTPIPNTNSNAGSLECAIATQPGTPPDLDPVTDTDVGNSKSQCNEFNCFAGWVKGFDTSLDCAAQTLRNDIAAGKSLAQTLDEYGPFCDNETVSVSANGNSKMPFLYNFFGKIYDKYAIQPRSCNELPPNKPRSQDVKMQCDNISKRMNTLQWNVYRGAVEQCTLSGNQMTWGGSTKGMSVDQVTDKVYSEVVYGGWEAGTAPKQKVKAVIQKAKDYDLNPYLLVGLWGTESGFGQSRTECNVF